MESGEGMTVENTSKATKMPWALSTQLSPSVFTLEPFGNVYGDNKLSNRERSVIEAIENRFHNSCPKCKSKLDIYQCVSCSNSSTWYSAISNNGTGAVHGFFNARDKVDTLLTSNYEMDGLLWFSRLDIALPVSGNEEELDEFCVRLGATIDTIQRSSMGKNLATRLLLTRYESSGTTSRSVDALRNLVSDLTKLKIEDIIIVHVSNANNYYSRANAIFICTKKHVLRATA